MRWTSSKNFKMLTSSFKPLRLLVLIINSLAKCGVGAGSNGFNTMDLSNGSPGNRFQWSNILKQYANPDVCILKSVSNPKWSIIGICALTI